MLGNHFFLSFSNLPCSAHLSQLEFLDNVKHKGAEHCLNLWDVTLEKIMTISRQVWALYPSRHDRGALKSLLLNLSFLWGSSPNFCSVQCLYNHCPHHGVSVFSPCSSSDRAQELSPAHIQTVFLSRFLSLQINRHTEPANNGEGYCSFHIFPIKGRTAAFGNGPSQSVCLIWTSFVSIYHSHWISGTGNKDRKQTEQHADNWPRAAHVFILHEFN